jgi:Phasin protein
MKDDVTPTDKPARATNGEGSIPGFGPWLNSNRAFESWTQSCASMMGSAAELYEELMTFWQGRFQADMDAWKAFASCRNPADFFECQRQFAEKTTAQYRDEANKLTSRIIGIVSSAASPFQQEQPSKS